MHPDSVTRESKPKEFMRGFILVLVLGLSVIGMTVAIVDPYGFVDSPRIDGFNAQKTRRIVSGGRVERSVKLQRGDFDTLIMGSSRAQSGIDPGSTTLAPLNAYNASLQAANMLEQFEVGRFVLARNPPDRIIFGVDFFTFTSHNRFRADYSSSGFAGIPVPIILARSLLSFTSLWDAIITISDNRGGELSQVQANGFLDKSVNRKKQHDYGAEFRRSLGTYTSKNGLYGAFVYDDERFDRLEEFVGMALEHGVDVYLFVAPVHAKQLEAIRAMELQKTFEHWKRRLASLSKLDGTGSRKLEIWDFSGYHSISTEPVPDPGSTEVMRYYWDSSHYKPIVGNMLVHRMLPALTVEIPVPSDLGVRLDERSVEAESTD